MELLVSLAVKSLLVAGATLVLLQIARHRSPAERSWIAHLGLAALVLLPVATLALPALAIEAPAALAAPIAELPAAVVAASAPSGTSDSATVAPAAEGGAVDWPFLVYGVPAGLLLVLTLLALMRLFALHSRAHVLVDPQWLSALAHAQRRMGFKHGTALLTSDELSSPISWGLMRPVILLNTDATQARGEAEAIIAHELAHVARLDWAKLLLARITVAIFWFNPLVWMLSREAHQLREETADDAVLSSDIVDTDYAELLVGIARHECRSMLIGAHGVAPSRDSLARRVRRVLDRGLARDPATRGWTAGVALLAVAVAAPLAALTLAPAALIPPAVPIAPTAPVTALPPAATVAPASAVAPTAIATVAIASASHDPDSAADPEVDLDADVDLDGDEYGRVSTVAARANATAARVTAQAAQATANAVHATSLVDQAIARKVHGVTPAYAAQIAAAAPHLGRLSTNQLVALKVQGVTPGCIRDLAAAGYRNLSFKQIQSSGIHDVKVGYARSMIAATGSRPSFDELIEMRILGVTARDVTALRRAGHNNLSAREIVKLQAFGVGPDDLREASRDP